MKYMGSKRALLLNGLGDILREEAPRSKRFVDLFAGTGRVSWHVAESTSVPVLASDLQSFSSILAGAVVERTGPIDFGTIERAWLQPARRSLVRDARYREAVAQDRDRISATAVKAARNLCATLPGGPVWNAYGGHYFSPVQAATFDCLLIRLPDDKRVARVCRAALILSASRCAAAPGHTAQPFQPTASALPYIASSWRRDPIGVCAETALALAPRHARARGRTATVDANELAKSVRPSDLVFIDPPYSAVHYSRFYHVLETVARGDCGPVEGVGRYPPTFERPHSDYSVKTQAPSRMADLLRTLRERECRVIITFPQGRASNGIAGEELIELARESFEVEARVLASHFSTMGGNNGNRAARRRSTELIIRLNPR